MASLYLRYRSPSAAVLIGEGFILARASDAPLQEKARSVAPGVALDDQCCGIQIINAQMGLTTGEVIRSFCVIIDQVEQEYCRITPPSFMAECKGIAGRGELPAIAIVEGDTAGLPFQRKLALLDEYQVVCAMIDGF